MKPPQRKRVFILQPAGLLDRTDARVMQHAGAEVQKVSPVGCPPNGTMGQCFVQTIDGDFIGLVNLSSLVRTNKTMVPVDKAAEARDRTRRRFI